MGRFPTPLPDAITSYWPRLRLSIENLDFPFVIGSGYHKNPNPQPATTIPASNAVSVSMRHGTEGRIIEPIQDLLVASKNLESLELTHLPAQFQILRGRLPPLKKLVLDIRHWPYSEDEVTQIWDFSRLEDLEIKWYTLGPCLTTGYPTMLPSYEVSQN